jgi:DNA-3-methyladenine glycosylase
MQLGPRYSRAFFAQPCLEVAPALLGAYLVRKLKSETLVGRIVEVEAYLGDGTDPGAHSHRGPTPRTRAMFGAPGHLYVYLSYGIHTCANVVCEPEGSAAAVLLRAIEPMKGLEKMRALRSLAENTPASSISDGPGKLCQSLGITLDDYGHDLLRGEIELRKPSGRDLLPSIEVTRRVGLTKGADLPYRFFTKGRLQAGS